MRLDAVAIAVFLSVQAFAPGTVGLAAESAGRDSPQADAPAPKTPAEIRAELYGRLSESKDVDETEGLIGLMLAAYGRSDSDTGDLLLQRARTAIEAKDYDAAGKILDAAVAFMPDEAAAWNARATLRYLDDDADGSMADIAETLKRDPRHLGALVGMASILEEQGKTKEALEVYRRALKIAPHWKDAEEAAARLEAKVAGQAL